MGMDIHRQAAALHAANIDRGFLATLGIPFLSLMYRAIDEAEGSVLLTELRDGRVCGFVAGGLGMTAIYRRMLRHPIRLGWALLPVLFKPSVWRRIFDILRYGRSTPSSVDLPNAELLSIAVAPEVRGSGVAESLYRRLECHFRQQGVDAFKITVGDVLTSAHRFYARMGAVVAGKVEVHAGEPSTVFLHDLGRRGAVEKIAGDR